MRRGLSGELTAFGPGFSKQWPTATCEHCNKIVKVVKEDDIGWCYVCMKPICNQCIGKGCDPIEEKLLRWERQG